MLRSVYQLLRIMCFQQMDMCICRHVASFDHLQLITYDAKKQRKTKVSNKNVQANVLLSEYASRYKSCLL